MNTFVTIKKVTRFNRVTYYSVMLDLEGIALYSKFIKRHSLPQYNEDMDTIRRRMQQMGDSFGASTEYFRQERVAQAIPPRRGITRKSCKLSLYCLRMNHREVILFDGGEKTTDKAQDCPIVGEHFVLANKIANAIWRAFDQHLIYFDNTDDLNIPPNLQIPL